MDRIDDSLAAPQMMALAYARGEFRNAWGLLLNLDMRLFSVVARGREPLLSQMRLAWWREQIAKTATGRPKGEPLLAKLSDVETTQPTLMIGHFCNLLVDAWESLAACEGTDRASVLARVADLRAQAIFGSYATWCCKSAAQADLACDAGRLWGGLTLGFVDSSVSHRIDRLAIKPLSLLLMAAQVDARSTAMSRISGAIRLQLHALTGL